MTQTAVDPWTAASSSMSSAPSGQVIPDRVAQQRAIDPSADPFATPDSVGGPSGPRGPKWQDILGRLVVLQPVEKLIDQPIQGDTSGKTQTFYVANLTVLDGGPLTIVTPAKDVNGVQYPEQSDTHQVPVTFNRWYAYGAGVTVKLDNLKAQPLLLGVVKRCPTGAGYRAGKTPADTEREYAAWLEQMRQNPERAGQKPAFSWGVVDPSEAQRALALEWYRSQN